MFGQRSRRARGPRRKGVEIPGDWAGRPGNPRAMIPKDHPPVATGKGRQGVPRSQPRVGCAPRRSVRTYTKLRATARTRRMIGRS